MRWKSLEWHMTSTKSVLQDAQLSDVLVSDAKNRGPSVEFVIDSESGVYAINTIPPALLDSMNALNVRESKRSTDHTASRAA
jgi:hypothetical protein